MIVSEGFPGIMHRVTLCRIEGMLPLARYSWNYVLTSSNYETCRKTMMEASCFKMLNSFKIKIRRAFYSVEDDHKNFVDDFDSV